VHRGGRGTLQFLRQDLAPCTGALQLSGNQVVLAGHEEALRSASLRKPFCSSFRMIPLDAWPLRSSGRHTGCLATAGLRPPVPGHGNHSEKGRKIPLET
jgi:hypothetical protein